MKIVQMFEGMRHTVAGRFVVGDPACADLRGLDDCASTSIRPQTREFTKAVTEAGLSYAQQSVDFRKPSQACTPQTTRRNHVAPKSTGDHPILSIGGRRYMAPVACGSRLPAHGEIWIISISVSGAHDQIIPAFHRTTEDFMNSIDFIKMSFEMSKGWIMGLAADMKDAPLTAPTPNGGNHPLWCLGHLAYSEGNLISVLMG